MLKPINNHILIDPVKHESFMFSERTTYDEVGIVIDVPSLSSVAMEELRGTKVYFDSWLAAKFPKEGTEDFYWLVPYESIKAYEPLPA